jgi:glucose/arabinose dehydrogenase
MISLSRPEDQERFQVTTFASGLSFPTSMLELQDGSMLAAVNIGPSLFASSSAQLVRLVDSDRNGVADGTPTILASTLPGLVTSIRRLDHFVVVLSAKAGQETITLLRAGENPDSSLAQIGSLRFSFPAGFEHSTYALALRRSPADHQSIEIFFNIGAKENSSATAETVELRGDNANILLEPSQLVADSIHRLILTPNPDNTSFTGSINLIARGLRNAAGMVFSPTGDLFLQDNGIDGTPRDQSRSADELNRIQAQEIGQNVIDFGFPSNYIDSVTGSRTGPASNAREPVLAFLPLEGERSEGLTELALAPAGFGSAFSSSIFASFIGMTGRGGSRNEENPIVFANPSTGQYFHFIPNQLLGNPYGLTATTDSLYISDISSTGNLNDKTKGVIYRVHSTTSIPPDPPPTINLQSESISLKEGDPGSLTPFSFTVRRSGDLSRSSSVNWVVGRQGQITAKASDFGGTVPKGQVVFNPGQSSQTITVLVSGDQQEERNERFRLMLSNPSGASLGNAVAKGVILNDDTTINLQSEPISLPEGDSGSLTPFSFTVHRSGDLSRSSSVNWAVSRQGQFPAKASDFGGTFPAGHVVFNPGQSSQTITVLVSGDPEVERNERFQLTLSNPRGASLGNAIGYGAILNDDTDINLLSESISLPEGDSDSLTPFTFTVRRSGDLSRSSSVDWVVQGAGVNPADPWDFEGDRFPSGTVVFAPGESSRAITVKVRGDDGLETDERFQLTLSNAVGARLNSSALSAQASINNDDKGAWIYDWANAQPLGDTAGVLVAKLTKESFRPNEQDLNLTALRVDLSTPGLSLISTGAISDWQANSRETLTETTREFLTSNRQQGLPVVAAINTAFFDLTDGNQAVPTNLLGFAVSGGELVSPNQNPYPYFVQDKITGARLVRQPSSSPDPSGVNVAFAGMASGIVLWDGLVTGAANPTLNARTGLGLSRDNRFLTLLTVDRNLRSFLAGGATYWGSEIRDVGTLLAGFGSYTGMNLDGGGSTLMAWWDPASQSAQLLNSPLFGLERHVGSNLGIVYQQPLAG